jgi:regulatory protein
MPVVTEIRQQKNKNRANVYLDGVFGFGIDLDNLVLSGIKINKEFTEEEIEKIIKKAELQKTWEKLLKFASLRPRSEKEIKDWFKRKKVHESLYKDLFNRLKHLDLTDDQKFAEWWVEQRITFKPKGKRALVMELRQKGIKKEIINQVLADSPIDEEKMAKELLVKNAYKWERTPNLKAKQKMSEFLLRKGFSWEVVKKTVRIDQSGEIE